MKPLVDRLLSMRPLWAVLAAAHMTLIAWSSHRTWEGAAPSFRGAGNLMHVPLYFALGFMAAAALGVGVRDLPRGSRRAVAAVAWAVAFGIADEIHQSFVPGRTSSVQDVVVDLLSAAAAALALRAWSGEAPARRGRAIRVVLLLLGAAAVAVLPE